MTNVKKVAELAGVSTATVSRALSRPGMVAKVTREKVIAAATKAGYSGNYLARNLRTNKTSQVIVLVPNIANPFYSEVIRGIERVAHDHGYSVLLGDTQNSLARENAYTKMYTTKRADGLITLCPRLPKLDRSIQDADLLIEPIVNACECAPGTPMRTVQLDNKGAARKATDYLISLGHQRIGFVAGPPGSPLSSERFEGYKAAMTAAKLSTPEDLFAIGDFSVESGVLAAKQLLAVKQPPTAIFCSNDEMALGVMTVLKSVGIGIPDDISIVGFDNIHFAQYFDPSLTTVAQPMGDLGEKAMTVLCETLAGNPPKVKDIVLPFDLIVRDSTAVNRSL